MFAKRISYWIKHHRQLKNMTTKSHIFKLLNHKIHMEDKKR